ncbi:MAG: hypothetical protein CM1200mP2_35940 [Planctomycetaceae bacterium]|nr:MAG: hypothetical protein CM1200mP2_35940 [Planctomycetaceae bacterium]
MFCCCRCHYGHRRREASTHLAWKAGRLADGPKTADAVLVVIQHVNGHRFQEALVAIPELSGVETRLRSELALAVAGHLSNDNPQPAMRLARELLDQAIGADGDDLLARRLKNDLTFSRLSIRLSFPGLPISPVTAGFRRRSCCRPVT